MRDGRIASVYFRNKHPGTQLSAIITDCISVVIIAVTAANCSCRSDEGPLSTQLARTGIGIVECLMSQLILTEVNRFAISLLALKYNRWQFVSIEFVFV